jgi:hypothetical protein
MKRPIVYWVFLFASITAAVCGNDDYDRVVAQRPAVRLVHEEVPLGRRQAGEVQYSWTISPNRRRIAFSAKVPSGEAVFVDGIPGGTYTEIARYPLTESGVQPQIIFSADSRRVAYVAKRGQKFLVVVDNKAGQEFDNIRVGAPVFSAAGQRIAYEAKRGDKWHVVADGVEGKPFESVTALRFSFDNRLVYEGKRGNLWFVVSDGVETPREGYRGPARSGGQGRREVFKFHRSDKWHVVTDGALSSPYDSLGNNVELSEDGQHVHYRAESGGKQFVVLDGKDGQKYDSIEENSYKISPDGKRAAYLARDFERLGQKYVAVVDGKESKPHDHISEPMFSPDSRRVAYVASTFKPERQRVAHEVAIIDGIEGERFDRVGPYFYFSPNGGRVAYIAERNGKSVLVVDDKKFVYDKILDIKFSADGLRILFAAQLGSRTVLALDGQEFKSELSRAEPAQAKVWDSHEDESTFSPDGSRLAYVALVGGNDVAIVDGVMGQPYDDIDDLQFTADGKHIVYTARRGASVFVVVDQVEGKEYDQIMHGTFRLEDGRVPAFLAVRGQEFLRVALKIVGD